MDVRAASVFWKQMEIRDELSGSPSAPEWLSTHPSHRNRVNQLDRLIPQVAFILHNIKEKFRFRLFFDVSLLLCYN